MQLKMKIAAPLLLIGSHSAAARLSPPAESAFERYVAGVEARLAKQHSNPNRYLAALDAGTEHRLVAGGIKTDPVNGGTWGVKGGLLHHWRAAAFVANAEPKDMLALLRDYNHLARYYAPRVVSSRALTDEGETATLAMRLKEQFGFMIVLDAQYAIRTGLTDKNRGYSFSRSTHIWQVDEPGTAQERRRAEGKDDGDLWRLNSYWSFARMDDGLLIECEAVSLTRDVPAGLGWLITPIIESLPRTSLEFTLKATKNALAARATKRGAQ